MSEKLEWQEQDKNFRRKHRITSIKINNFNHHFLNFEFCNYLSNAFNCHFIVFSEFVHSGLLIQIMPNDRASGLGTFFLWAKVSLWGIS